MICPSPLEEDPRLPPPPLLLLNNRSTKLEPELPPSSSSPPIHFGRLKPETGLDDVESLFIHFGVSIDSNVFFTLRPKSVKKFSSSGSGSIAIEFRFWGCLVDVVALIFGFKLERWAGGTYRFGIGLLVVGRLLSREERVELFKLRFVALVLYELWPLRSRAMRSRPSRQPPVPKAEDRDSSSWSSNSSIPNPKTRLILPYRLKNVAQTGMRMNIGNR